MDLEPQAGPAAGQGLAEVLGLEAEAGRKRLRAHDVLLEPGDQDFIGVSEPMPWGVLMLVQVPTGTFFQALPW